MFRKISFRFLFRKLVLITLILSYLAFLFFSEITLSVVLLMLALLFSVLLRTRLRLSIPVFIAWYTLFCGLLFVPFIYENISHFWGNFIALFAPLILFFILRSVSVRSDDLSILKYMAWGLALITSVQLIILYISSGGFLIKHYIEIPYGKSNSIASILLFTILFIFYTADFNNWGKIRTILFALFALGVLILTQSAAGILIYLFFIAWYVVGKTTWSQRLLVLGLLLIPLLILIPVITNRHQLTEKLGLGDPTEKAIIRKLDEQQSGTGMASFMHKRLEAYVTGFDNFRNHPVFGVGIGNIKDTRNMFMTTEFIRTHNLFIDLLASTGVTGLLVYLMFLLYLFIAMRNKLLCLGGREYYYLRATRIAFIAVLVHAMVEPNFFNFKFSLFVFSFVLMALTADLDQYNEKTISE
jgi:O-antigen ligase